MSQETVKRKTERGKKKERESVNKVVMKTSHRFTWVRNVGLLEASYWIFHNFIHHLYCFHFNLSDRGLPGFAIVPSVCLDTRISYVVCGARKKNIPQSRFLHSLHIRYIIPLKRKWKYFALEDVYFADGGQYSRQVQ